MLYKLIAKQRNNSMYITTIYSNSRTYIQQQYVILQKYITAVHITTV